MVEFAHGDSGCAADGVEPQTRHLTGSTPVTHYFYSQTNYRKSPGHHFG
jgi:hypothetical protein